MDDQYGTNGSICKEAGSATSNCLNIHQESDVPKEPFRDTEVNRSFLAVAASASATTPVVSTSSERPHSLNMAWKRHLERFGRQLAHPIASLLSPKQDNVLPDEKKYPEKRVAAERKKITT